MTRALVSAKTFAFFWRTCRRHAGLLLITTVIASVLPLAITWVAKLIVDAVVAGSPGSGPSLGALIAIEACAAGALLIADRSNAYLRQLIGIQTAASSTKAIVRKAQCLSIGIWEQPSTSERLTKAKREATTRPPAFFHAMLTTLRSGIVCICYGMALWHYSSVWPVLIALATAPVICVEIAHSGWSYGLLNSRSAETRRLRYFEDLLSSIRYARELRLFSYAGSILERHHRLAEDLFRKDQHRVVQRALSVIIAAFVPVGAFYYCYADVVYSTAFGRCTIGEMTFCVLSLRQLQSVLKSACASIREMFEHGLYMACFIDFIEMPESTPDTRAFITGLPFEKGIRFSDVSFSYPGRTQAALKNISFYVPPGALVAIVGANGSGKSTICNLLLRFYEPASGAILLDGRDLRAWDEPALRARFSAALQDFSRYQFTVRENVAASDIGGVANTARVNWSLTQTSADRFVSGLPAGIESPLGRTFDEGAEPSAGQWQAIAVARALFRNRADILLLDEPTAFLDAAAEVLLLENLKKRAAETTIFVVTHRMSTAKRASQVLVMSDGNIVESGTHVMLMEKRGVYYELYSHQSRAYAI